MHIVDYAAAIREAARVASRYCILHTVPVFDDHRTTYLRKYAYGAPVVEIVFGRAELMSLCEQAGLRLERNGRAFPTTSQTSPAITRPPRPTCSRRR